MHNPSADAIAETFARGGQSDTAPETSTETPSSIIDALAESAKPVGEHATTNDTFAAQAKARTKRREARAREAERKRLADEKLASTPASTGVAYKSAPTAAAQNSAAKTAEESSGPGFFAKIFDPASWSATGTNEKPLEPGQVRGALQPDSP